MSTASGKTRDWLPLMLVVLALVVYLPGFGWGIPHASAVDRVHSWGNDDLVPLAPLAEMFNTFVEAQPNRNVAYPWFHYFLVAVAYAPYVAFLMLTGRINSPSGAYPFGIDAPEHVFRTLSWIGRSVTLALALLTVVAAYYAAKWLWGRHAGLASGIFVMLLYPITYYARLGNLDVPVLAWTMCALATCALCLARGVTTRRAVALGVFLAIAFATKDQSAGSFLFLIPALIVWFVATPSDPRPILAKLRPIAASLAAFTAAYLLASGAVVDPQRFVEHTGKVFSVGAGTVELYNRYPPTLAGYRAQTLDLLRYLVDVMSWPVLLLSLAGVVLAARRMPRTLLLLLSSLGMMAILLPVRFSRLHYLLPVAVPLTLFAGYAVSVGWQHGRRMRVVTLAAAIVAAGYLLLLSIDLSHAMMRDSRYAAGDWLEKNTRAGDRLMHFGASMSTPRLGADVKTIMVEYRADAEPAVATQRPEFILIVTDDTNEDRRRIDWRQGIHSIHSDYLPKRLFTALADGSAGYRLVAQFQSPRLMPWLPRPFLSYPTVNPPIHIFVREDRAGTAPRLKPWLTAPHYPKPRRIYEPGLPTTAGQGS